MWPIMNLKQHLSDKNILKPLCDAAEDIPDIRSGIPLVTISGQKDMIIENFENILEYTSESIRINSKDIHITVSGRGLQITSYSLNEIHIKGMIDKIEYI